MTSAPQHARVIGRQLRAARELVGLSPREVALHLGVTQQDVERWEADAQQPSAEVLWEIAHLYNRSPDYFLKHTPATPREIKYQLLGRNSLDQLTQQTRATIARFEELCRWEYEVEALLGERRPATLPRVSRDSQPDAAAREERLRLGLNGRPVISPRDLAEAQGIRVFELEVPGGEFAGFSWWSNEYGPCVLANASDSAGRRHFTLLHEYAHLLRRLEATICDLTLEDDDEERFANRFAAEFLMPADDIALKADELGLVGKVPGAEDLKPLANRYNVSLEAAGRRLEELRLIPSGSTDLRRNEWQQQALFRRRSKTPRWRRRLGNAYVKRAFAAYSRGRISLSRLAELLDVDIRQAKEAYGRETG